MSSLFCPHLLEAYLEKSSEIIDIYQPQIVEIVPYDLISPILLKRRVVKKRENKLIHKCNSQIEKMEKLLAILKVRIWGLENFITILIEQNVDNWLAKELFQAYIRHLVPNMKKLQTRKICDCFQGSDESLLHYSWFFLFEKLETWLNDIGKSFGCLGKRLDPVRKILEFFRERLRLKSKAQTLRRLAKFEEQSSSDSSESEEDAVRIKGTRQQQQSSMVVGTMNFCCRERAVSAPNLFTSTKPEIQKLSSSLSPLMSTSVANNYIYSKFQLSQDEILNDDLIDETAELTWDDEADPYPSLSPQTEYILELLEKIPSERSHFSSKDSIVSIDTTSEDFDISYTAPKASVSTQTSPLFVRKLSLSLTANSLPYQNSNIETHVKREEAVESNDNDKSDSREAQSSTLPQLHYNNYAAVNPQEINENKESTTQLTSETTHSTVNSIILPKSTMSKRIPKTIVKSTSAKGPSSNVTRQTRKVATIPRQRVLEEFKVKKLQGNVPVSSVHEDRLKPEDYGKWSNTNLNRSRRNDNQSSTHGANVA